MPLLRCFVCAFFLFPLAGSAQIAQAVRGTVTDAESGRPIEGVAVVLMPVGTASTLTDSAGRFYLSGVALGRQTFLFTLTGFEPHTAADAAVISGKEAELNIRLKESLASTMAGVTVRAARDRSKAQNEYATLSARSFSPEETRRYAASFADPARMVMNYPGVSSAGDGDNSIVVRGNSPKGVLWRLEGIEIPNPNHFSDLGGSGGPISMLNAATLGQSDFYTGAFTPEIGNALSGAFDLSFRAGSTTRREHAVQIGAMGVEAATEGPFRKGGPSSYLINYRYSTVALLESFTGLEGILPLYQDAAVKLHFPTKHWGTFSVFGLGGYNSATRAVEKDSTRWAAGDNWGYDERGKTGIAGVSHQYFLGKDAYLKTVVSASYNGSAGTADTVSAREDYRSYEVERTGFDNAAYRASALYNQKVNARHAVRAGAVAQHWRYGYTYTYFDDADRRWKSVLGDTGSTQYYQAYAQWKARLGARLTIIGGAHASYYALAERGSVEPRVSAVYSADTKARFSVAAGLHSKPEHPSTHLYQTPDAQAAGTFPNRKLDLLRAAHVVAGYERSLPMGLRAKAEAYYQHLYNIPVEAGTGGFSLLNADGIYSLLRTERALQSTGTGENYGVDLSLERPFSAGWYLTAAGSLYRSTYTDAAGATYHTRFDRGYNANIIGGREFRVGRGARNVLGLNGKVLASGGLRESPIDLEASRAAGRTEVVAGKYFSSRGAGYFRADASVYYRINRRASTHTFQLDVQNATNRDNYYASYYDARADAIRRESQLGLLPNVSYRVEFYR